MLASVTSSTNFEPKSMIRMNHAQLAHHQQEIIQSMRSAWLTEIRPTAGSNDATLKACGMTNEPVGRGDIRSSLLLLKPACRAFPCSYTEEHLDFHTQFPALWQFDPLDGTVFHQKGDLSKVAMHATLLVRHPDGNYLPYLSILFLPHEDKLWFTDPFGKLKFFDHGREAIPGCLIKDPNADPRQLRAYNIVGNLPLDQQKRSREKAHQLSARIAEALKLDFSGPTLSGSGGFGFAMLLDGKVDLFINNLNDSKVWDVAMASQLVPACGGELTGMLRGRFQSFHNLPDPILRDGVIATVRLKSQWNTILSCIRADHIENLA